MPEPTSSIEPMSPLEKSSFDTVEIFRKKAFHPPADAPTVMAPWKTWFLDVVEACAQLSDMVRTFQLEIFLHQFDTEIATFFEQEPPAALVYADYERPTTLAYNARIRELIAQNIITAEEYPFLGPDATIHDQKLLPADRYIKKIPSFQTDVTTLSIEEKDEVKRTLQSWVDQWNASELIVEIKKDLQLSRGLLHVLASDDGWELVRESDGIKTFYRQEKDVATYSFKVDGVVKAPLMELFQLIYEVAMFQEWFPMMRSAREVAEENRFSKVCESTVAAVWPFSDRQLLLECKGIDHSQMGRILINLRDLPKDNKHYTETPSSFVKCHMIHGGFCLTPKSFTETHLSFYSNVDPQLSLPTSLINMVTGKMIHVIIPTMTENAPKTKGPNSKWAKELEKHAAVYKDIGEKMKLFFPEECAKQEEDAAAANK